MLRWLWVVISMSLAVGTPPPLAALDRYDPVANTWLALAPMAQARFDFAAVAVGLNYVYVAGGSDNTLDLSSVEQYSVAENIWTSVAPLPTGRQDIALTAL
jgi:hypothetical protein